MNIGFSDWNIEYRFTKKTGFFFHFSHICNFVFRVQYAVFICLMMHQRSEFGEIIVLQKLNVKAKLSVLIHRNAREIKGAKVSTTEPEENFDKHTRKHLSQRVTIWQHKDHVLNYYSPRTAEEAEEEQE